MNSNPLTLRFRIGGTYRLRSSLPYLETNFRCYLRRMQKWLHWVQTYGLWWRYFNFFMRYNVLA